MIDAIEDALASVISFFGTVVTSITGSSGALKDLLPVFALSIGIALVYAGIKLIRRLTYGA